LLVRRRRRLTAQDYYPSIFLKITDKTDITDETDKNEVFFNMLKKQSNSPFYLFHLLDSKGKRKRIFAAAMGNNGTPLNASSQGHWRVG